MNVTAETHGHAVILNVEGDLNEDSLGAFDKAVTHYFTDREAVDLILNLARTQFVDSAALERLLDLQDSIQENLGQLKLARPDQNVRKILELTRLEGVLPVFDDVPEAVKAGQA